MVSIVDLDSVGESPLAGDSSSSLSYTDAQIQRAVCYAFAAFAGLGSVGIAAVSYFGVFQVSVLYTVPLAVIAGGFIYFASKIPDAPTRTINLAHSRFEEMYRKHGLDALLQKFSLSDLKQKFAQEIQDPKTTFWSVLQTYDTQALYDRGIIDQNHLSLLQQLKQRAEAHKDICFPHQKRHVLTLFANEPEAFKAIIALDAEYKEKVGIKSTPPVVNLDAPVELSTVQVKLPNYVDARIKRAVCYVFAVLAGLATLSVAAVAYFGVFKISMAFALLPLAATIACLSFASKIIDYQDDETKKNLRARSQESGFVNLYREHGLSNLLQVFQVNELKEKFNAEVRNPKTTFWNVLRRYDLQALHQAGIITSQYLAVLTNLRRLSAPLNLAVYPKKERWKQAGWFSTSSSTSCHVHTAFANEPEAYRMAEALDRAYRTQVEGFLKGSS